MSDHDGAWAASTPKRIGDPATADASGLRSVGTALDVLECFATDGELGVTDVARRLGVAKSTAHRILTTLSTRGFIEQDSRTGLYRLGLHVFELGHLSQVRNELRHAALPTMRRLAAQTGHTVNFGVPDGGDVVFVERIEIGSGGTILSHSGRRFPAHTTSSGKVLAAFNPAVRSDRLRAGFPPRASGTIRSEADFEAAMNIIRRDGFATSHDESFDGASSVAVPVLKHDVAVASLSIFGTTATIDSDLARLLSLLRAASNRIAGRLPG